MYAMVLQKTFSNISHTMFQVILPKKVCHLLLTVAVDINAVVIGNVQIFKPRFQSIPLLIACHTVFTSTFICS